VEVWPENWPAFTLFTRLGSQWRVGMNGAIGLDHNVLFHRMDRMGLSADDYAQLDDDICVMEQAALSAIRESQESS
jgi:hypothetical protein